MSEREHAAAAASAPTRNITTKESGAAGDITIVRPAAAAAPTRRRVRVSLQVEMRRAGLLGHHPPRDKEHQLASRKCRSESTPRPQRRPRPGISLQRNPAPPATSPSCGQQQPLHRPGGGCGSVCRSRCAAPDCSATTRQGIKNTSSPAGNVGARARRGRSQRGFRSGLSASSTP